MEELFEKQRKFGGKSVRLCKQSYAQGNPQRGGDKCVDSVDKLGKLLAKRGMADW